MKALRWGGGLLVASGLVWLAVGRWGPSAEPVQARAERAGEPVAGQPAPAERREPRAAMPKRAARCDMPWLPEAIGETFRYETTRQGKTIATWSVTLERTRSQSAGETELTWRMRLDADAPDPRIATEPVHVNEELQGPASQRSTYWVAPEVGLVRAEVVAGGQSQVHVLVDAPGAT